MDEKKKAKRKPGKDTFMGFYGPAELKRALEENARREHRTLSGELCHIAEAAVRKSQQEGAAKESVNAEVGS